MFHWHLSKKFPASL